MAIHHQLNPHLWPSSKHYILENCHGQPTPRRNSRPNMSLGLMKTHWFPLIRTLFNPYFWGVGYVRWGLGWLAMNNATFAPRTQGFPHMTPLNSNGTWIKLSLIPRKKKTWGKDQDDPTTRQYAVLSRLGSELFVVNLWVIQWNSPKQTSCCLDDTTLGFQTSCEEISGRRYLDV